MDSIIALENTTYEEATSLDAYNHAVNMIPDTQDQTASLTPNSAHQNTQLASHLEEPSTPGERVGPHQNCHLIATGLTSHVYQTADKLWALKVITTTSNIAPHSPSREAKMLLTDLVTTPNVIKLHETFRDHEQRLVLVFPYMPLTLADVLDQRDANDGNHVAGIERTSSTTSSENTMYSKIFRDVLSALRDIHAKGIIHRDIKPSAILLSSTSSSPHAYLSDFGTAWHPTLSPATEPPSSKILDIGTGPYRAPEVLFGHAAYTTAVDMWSLGVVISEAVCGVSADGPARPVFESRPAHEDGSQLGLILSIFKTLGTPTVEDWPEAAEFKVTPFELWTVFPKRSWEEILPRMDGEWRDLVSACLRFGGERLSAEEALEYSCLKESRSESLPLKY